MMIEVTTFSETAPENISELKTMKTLDYKNGPRYGVVVLDGIIVTQALRANAQEGWVDLYVALGIDKTGRMTPARIIDRAGRRGDVAIYRVYGNLTILELDPNTAEYIKKEAK